MTLAAEGRQREATEHALEQIDKVHAGHIVPHGATLVDSSKISKGAAGEYAVTAKEIRVVGDYPNAESTAVHELGHMIHDQVFNWAGGMVRGGDLAHWEKVVGESPNVQELWKAAKSRAGQQDAVSVYVTELAKHSEQFARDYEHYIATRSGNAKLLSQIDSKRSAPFGYLAFRSEKNFKPVAKAFDKIFKAKGALNE